MAMPWQLIKFWLDYLWVYQIILLKSDLVKKDLKEVEYEQ